MSKITYIITLGTFLLLNSCLSQDHGKILTESERLDLLNQVWNTVNEQFYDPHFNGINWQAKYEQYKPLIANSSQTDSLFTLLNKMLFELNSSHCGIGLLSSLKNNASPYIFMDGTIGIDIRVIDSEIIIVKVIPNSSAALSDLKTGFVIKEIDGLSLVDFKKTTNYKPPFNKRNKKFHLTTEILRHIYGKFESSVTIDYLDENNNLKSVRLIRTKRKEGIYLVDWLPPLFIESESFFLTDNIAYLRFNAFQPDNLEHVIDDLKKVSFAKGLIIDFRGNDGGSIEAMKRLVGRFVSKRIKYGTYSNRYESNDDFIVPLGEQFKGKVVVLVDEMSISGAENAAGIMQLLNIATIIGTQTPGQLLWGNSYLINDSISLVIPIYKIEYTNGFNPENNGVKPDVEIELNRKDLLKGKDTQLEMAIKLLSEEIK